MSAERIRTAEAARITGLDPRTLQEKAAAGLIPGARKVARGRREWVTSVYFIQSPHAIKIGRSNDSKRRLAVLQTSQSEPLRLVACTPGGRELETEYHRQFAKHRLHGEWFSPAPEILAEIARLNAQVPA